MIRKEPPVCQNVRLLFIAFFNFASKKELKLVLVKNELVFIVK